MFDATLSINIAQSNGFIFNEYKLLIICLLFALCKCYIINTSGLVETLHAVLPVTAKVMKNVRIEFVLFLDVAKLKVRYCNKHYDNFSQVT